MAKDRYLIAFTLALAVALPCVAQKPATTKPTVRKSRNSAATEDFQKAIAAVQQKDFATAEPLLKKAADDDPQNYQAWFYLGYIYNSTGRRPDAIRAYKKAVELQPAVFESNLNLGMLLAAEGSTEAAKYLVAAGKLKSNAEQQEALGRAWYSLAQLLESTDFAGATDAFQRAAELRPKDERVWLDLGQLQEKHKDLTGAEKSYRKAAEVNPANADSLALLSNLYMRSNRYPDAETTLRAFVQANPQNATAHLQLGRVLRAQGKNDEASAELEKALELSPTDNDALRELASVQMSARKYDAAAATLRTLAAKQPNDPELHYTLGGALMRSGKNDLAQQEFLTTVKLKPTWGEAYGELAVAANANKDYQLAIRALDARAKFLPETAGTYFLRATCLDHLKAFKEASAQYKLFLSVSAGKYPDEEWKARHRLIAIDPETREKNK